MAKHIDLAAIAERYGNEESARAFLEATRWPHGAVCPKCGCINARRLGSVRGQRKGLGKVGKSKPCPPGLWFCLECEAHFTVTVGTVMEASKIPLHKWLLAMYLMGASKKGVSAHQLHRTLGITYKSAWFLAHRIRYAMTQEPLKTRLGGVIEFDETYMGGKMRNTQHGQRQPAKYPVVSLVQRGGGSRSFHVANVTAANLRKMLQEHVEDEAKVYSDSAPAHQNINPDFDHHMVNHQAGEYVRGPVHTNTVEGFFSILKRGIYGVYHHVSPQHLQRYLDEFDYRYSNRSIDDSRRAIGAIRASQGKRLKYRELPAHEEGAKTKGKRFWHDQTRKKDYGPQQPQPPFGPSADGDYS